MSYYIILLLVNIRKNEWGRTCYLENTILYFRVKLFTWSQIDASVKDQQGFNSPDVTQIPKIRE